MSLNDYARLSNNDLELYKQLSDSSYKSINGKRQSTRNFKDGVLNLGQIHFEQPKDVLTKEMILEYQKEQQRKPAYIDTITGDQFQYVPSNINDPLNPYNPVNLPSGAPATEGDINLKRDDLNIVLSNVDVLSNDEKVKKQLLDDLRLRLNKLGDEEKKIGDKLNKLNTLQSQTKNKIKTLDSNISTKTSKLTSLVQAAAINRAKKEIDELEEEKKQQESLLKEVQSQITILQPQEADIQAEIANIIKLIKDTERDLRNIIRNLGTEKALIPNLETELTQLVENFEQNKKMQQKLKDKIN